MSEKINYTFIIILFVLIGVMIGSLEILYNQGAFNYLIQQGQQSQTTTTTTTFQTETAPASTSTTATTSEVPLFPNPTSGSGNPPLPPT